MLSVSKCVQFALLRQDHAVVPTAWNLFDNAVSITCWAKFDFTWYQTLIKVLLAQLSILSTAPGIKFITIHNSKRVVAASTNLNHLVMSKRLNLLWVLNIFKVAMAALSFVIRWPATTPWKESPGNVKSKRMIVTAVDLNDSCLLVD